MLPVVASPRRVTTHMLAHSSAMVACSLLLVPVAPMGLVYTGSAAVLGVLFLREVFGLRRRVLDGVEPRSMRLFHWSISYLSLISLAVIIDVVVHVPV